MISREVGGEVDWKRLAKKHICIYAQAMDTDNNVVKAGVGKEGRGGEGWVEGVKGEKTVDL